MLVELIAEWRRRIAAWALGRLACNQRSLSLDLRLLWLAYVAKRLGQRSLRCGPRVFRPAVAGRLIQEFDTHFWLRLNQLSRPLRRAEDDLYAAHVVHRRYAAGELDAMRQLAANWEFRPLVAVLTPTFQAEPAWLDRLYASIAAQAYDRWEWVLVDDGSKNGAVLEKMRELESRDDRIIVERLSKNGGVVAATNRAAELASGELLAFVDHDDELAPDALWHVVAKFAAEPELEVVYTDEEFVPADRSAYPHFKPDFAPESLVACNFVCHLMVVRRSTFEEENGLRAGADGAQDHELVLRLARRGCRFGHVPRVLYRWHLTPHSLSRAVDRNTGRLEQVDRLVERTRGIVQQHLNALGVPADVERMGDWVRPRFRPENRGLATIIVCTRDRPELLSRCIESIEAKTSYPNYEILIVDNESQLPATARLLAELKKRHRIMRLASGPEGFNFARLNNEAAVGARGEYLVFLNNDTEVLDKDWLSALVGWLQAPGIGAVGARLLFPNGRIQHAGVIVGAMDWGPWHLLRDLPGDSNAFHGYLQLPHNNLAATGACLATRRATFLAHGGFDVERFAVCFNDVDYCLRLANVGLRTVYEPQATLCHYESSTRPATTHPVEAANLKRAFDGIVDPYWNPNYTRESYCFEINARRQSRRVLPVVPRVVAIAPSRPNRHEAPVEELLAAIAGRADVRFDVLRSDGALWEGAEGLTEQLAMAQRDGCNVAWIDGLANFEMVHRAAGLGMPVVWRVCGRLVVPDSLMPRERARFLAALALPYQIVFDCRFHRLEAERGIPRGNYCVIESVPLDAAIETAGQFADCRHHVVESADPARSLATMRAMQKGLPIIATRAVACADLLQPGVTGLEYREFDLADRAACIARLGVDDGLCRRLGEGARQWILTRRSLDRVLADWADLLQEAAELGLCADSSPEDASIGVSAKWPATAREFATRRS